MKRMITGIVFVLILMGATIGVMASEPDDSASEAAESPKSGSTQEAYVATTKEAVVQAGESEKNRDDSSTANNGPAVGNSENNRVRISADEAAALALKKVPGTVTEFDKDEDDGRIYYDMEIVTKEKKEKDVVVDADSGKVYVENDHDDDTFEEDDDNRKHDDAFEEDDDNKKHDEEDEDDYIDEME
ncbi:hypothetical protein EWH99_01510 [Sporolactobacillus sp. THM7-7]|nr:hypothetical protein EWH99_01510 [Sporolactobacillus sp. THM7-7]